jgi:hypothetical protein
MTADQLAFSLGARRSGRQYKCRCVAHNDVHPSMIIFDGRDSVQVRCLAGCEPLDIIAKLRERGLWHGDYVPERSERADVSREKTFALQREMRMRHLARDIFDDAWPINGTLAEKYFDGRDLLVDAKLVPDIRFHPRCPREQHRQGAVVVAMRAFESNELRAIQRIFLTIAGRKDGAMMLGSPAGTAMKLQPRGNHRLEICEGLETGLAVMAMGTGPVWALGSAALVQSFPVLEDIKTLIVWADHDAAGERAARVCSQRWLAAGRDVDICEPAEAGWDQADVWSFRCARG